MIEIRLAGAGDRRRGEQFADFLRGGAEFFAIVGANDALARGERERLEHAGIGDANQSGLGRRRKRDTAEPRRGKSGFAKDFARAKFAAAGLHRGGMVVGDSQAARNIRRCDRRPVAKRQNAVNAKLAVAHRLQNFVGRGIRRLEMNGDRAIAPGIIELVAAIGDESHLDIETACCFVKGASLIAELAGEQEHALAWRCACVAHTNPSGAGIASGCGGAFFVTAPIETS